MAAAARAFPQIIGAAFDLELVLVEQMGAIILLRIRRAVGAHQGLAPVCSR